MKLINVRRRTGRVRNAVVQVGCMSAMLNKLTLFNTNNAVTVLFRERFLSGAYIILYT